MNTPHTIDRGFLTSQGLTLHVANIVMGEIERLRGDVETHKAALAAEKAHSVELAERLENVQRMRAVTEDQLDDSDGELQREKAHSAELAARLEDVTQENRRLIQTLVAKFSLQPGADLG